MDKIKIKRSSDADTRTAKEGVTKDVLEQNTLPHIDDVQRVGFLIADLLKKQVLKHDYTKLKYMDEFYQDFTSGKQGKEFKELSWWKKHMTERHHLKDSVPEDVNLIDVLEMVIDCTVAGLARGGSADKIYPIEIPADVLNKAIENTKQLIIDNTELSD